MRLAVFDGAVGPEEIRQSVAALGEKERVTVVAKVLLPGADQQAAILLARLPQPFTLSEARQALGTSRRVAVPLMELLASQGRTVRLADSRHEVVR